MLPVPLLDFRRAPLTLILLAVIVALEVVCTLDPEQRHYYYNDVQLGIWWQIWDGQIWRPLTTTLLHGGLIHMVFNAFLLATFGPVLEDRVGPLRMLIVVVLLAYVSSLLQYVTWGFFLPVAEQSGGVGFSGVVFGLAGVLWAGRRQHPEFEIVCNRTVMQFLIFWFFLCILLSVARLWPIANIAHGSGLLFGLLYGRALFESRRRARWIALAVGASALVLSTMVGCPGNKAYEHVQRLRREGLIQLTPESQPRDAPAVNTESNLSARREPAVSCQPKAIDLPLANDKPFHFGVTRSTHWPSGGSGRDARCRFGAARRASPRSEA